MDPVQAQLPQNSLASLDRGVCQYIFFSFLTFQENATLSRVSRSIYNLTGSSRFYQLVLFLHRAGQSLQVVSDHINYRSVATLAAVKDRIDVLQALHDCDIDFLMPDPRHELPMHLAAMHGSEKAFSFLVDLGLDLQKSDDYQTTARNLAVERGQTNIIRILQSYEIDFQTIDQSGTLPFVQAVEYGHIELLQMFASMQLDFQGCDGGQFNVFTMLGETGCYYSMENYQRVITILLEQGLDILMPDNDGFCITTTAAANGRVELLSLLKHSYDIDMNVFDGRGQLPSTIAAKNDQVQVLKFLHQTGVDMKKRDLFGYTPIETAENYESTEATTYLASVTGIS